jgi:nucleoside-diphosphate-sugar epimerase
MANLGQRDRIFITGGSGYIGSKIVEFAISEGYEVYSLSRSEKSDSKLRSMGAVPVRGSLHSLDVLRRESAQAQVVLHLADAWDRNFDSDYSEVVRIDAAAVDAMGEPLQGTGKPLIVTSGSLVVEPDPAGGETTESAPLSKKPLNKRIRCEQHALQLCEKGIKVCAIRLAPYVYGHGRSGINLIMLMSANNGEVIYVNNGRVRTSAVHVDDAARLYLLAAKKAKAGDIFNGTSSTDIMSYQIAEAIGSCLKIPARSLTFEEAASKLGNFFAAFISSENRASNAKAVKELGWQLRELGMLEDIRTGSYVAVAEGLQKSRA